VIVMEIIMIMTLYWAFMIHITQEYSGDYMHDLKLLRAQGGEGFVGQPKSLFPGSTYRYG
jgi:hypothetical protein